MIRSRDLVLFVLVFLFIGIAIFATVAQQKEPRESSVSEAVFLENTSSSTLSARKDVEVLDRTFEASRLKMKISEDPAAITRLAEYLVATQEFGASGEEDVPVQVGEIMSCGEKEDTLAIAQNYPATNISVQVQDLNRIVLYVESGSEINATSLLTVLLHPTKKTNPVCVNSDIVGVTTEGALIFNNDTALYTTYTSDVLIGYARDGFPIYGVYGGQTDVCGGYEHPNGYRYTISPQRDFILGCYQATPQSFNLP